MKVTRVWAEAESRRRERPAADALQLLDTHGTCRVRVESDAGAERIDGGLFRVAAGTRAIEDIPGEAGAGTIAQGMVEESNVDFSAAMIELLMIQRAYAASAQIVQSADQLSSITNNLKRG